VRRALRHLERGGSVCEHGEEVPPRALEELAAFPALDLHLLDELAHHHVDREDRRLEHRHHALRVPSLRGLARQPVGVVAPEALADLALQVVEALDEQQRRLARGGARVPLQTERQRRVSAACKRGHPVHAVAGGNRLGPEGVQLLGDVVDRVRLEAAGSRPAEGLRFTGPRTAPH